MTYISITNSNNNSIPRGLPLAKSSIEQTFPKLTSQQISRITPRGQMRTIQRGEILYEQGDNAVPFFVILSGELEIVRPVGTAAVETLVVVLESGQSLGRSIPS